MQDITEGEPSIVNTTMLIIGKEQNKTKQKLWRGVLKCVDHKDVRLCRGIHEEPENINSSKLSR